MRELLRSEAVTFYSFLGKIVATASKNTGVLPLRLARGQNDKQKVTSSQDDNLSGASSSVRVLLEAISMTAIADRGDQARRARAVERPAERLDSHALLRWFRSVGGARR